MHNVNIYFGDDIVVAEYLYRELRLLCMRVNGDGEALTIPPTFIDSEWVTSRVAIRVVQLRRKGPWPSELHPCNDVIL